MDPTAVDVNVELEAKNAELEALRQTYEEYMESSLALEQELEETLKVTEENCEAMAKKKHIAEEKLSQLQDKYTQVSKDINSIQSELAAARDQISAMDEAKRMLECSNEELQEKVRILEATEENLQHKLQSAEEDLVLLKCEMDDLKGTQHDREQQLKTELTELQAEMAQLITEKEELESSLANGTLNSADIPQQRNADKSFHDGEDELDAGPQSPTVTSLPDGVGLPSPKEAMSPEQGGLSIQEELIQELELELEALTSKLTIVEQQNEQLTDEIGKMSEEIIEMHEKHAQELLEARQQCINAKENIAEHETATADVSNPEVERGGTASLPDDETHSKEEWEELNSKLVAAQENIDSLKKELSSVSTELANAREDLLEVDMKGKARADVVALLEVNVAELTEQLQQKNEELATVVAVAAEVKASHDAFMEELQASIRSLAGTIEEITEEKEQLEQRLKDKEAAMESLSLKISALNGWEDERTELQLTLDMWKKRAAAVASPGSASRSKSPSRSMTPSRRISYRPSSANFCEDIIGDQISKSMTPAAKELLGIIPEATSLVGTISPGRLTSPIASPANVNVGSATRKARRIITRQDVVIDDSSSLSLSAAKAIESGDTSLMSAEILSLAKLLDSLRLSNARLLKKFQSVRGNILVGCRTRPPSAAEMKHSHGNKICVDVIDDNELACFDKKSDVWRPFFFDRVWPMNASQADVFADVEPLVMSVVDGYNCCLFAYGQTGSGKTFTMNGYGEQYGVSYRTLHRMFELLTLKEMQAMNDANIVRCRARNTGSDVLEDGNSIGQSNNLADPAPTTERTPTTETADAKEENGDSDDDSTSELPFKYEVKVSMMEIYNDQVMDLLVLPGTGRPLDIRQATDGSISVPDLIQVSVRCFDDVMSVFAQGSACRATASTNMNEHSSRSHLLLQVDVTTTVRGETPVKAKLFLVDLAGSERLSKTGAVGTAMKEAQYINKSLSALGDVMEALDQKSKHIPYRNSKLTYLLQDCLGGNSRTMMVITLCPTESTSDETLFTLQFATRVRNIILGAARKNVNSKNLEDALKSLKVMLRDSKKKRSQLEETVADLRKEVKKTSEKMSTQMDTKIRLVEDFKKDAASQIAALTKYNTDLESRMHEEREARGQMQLEIDNLHKMLKKANEQVKDVQRDREAVIVSAKQKEREIAYLKLRTGTSAVGRSDMLASTAALSGDALRSLTSPKTLALSPTQELNAMKTPISTANHLTSPNTGSNHKTVGAEPYSIQPIAPCDEVATINDLQGNSGAVAKMLPPSSLPMRLSAADAAARKLKYGGAGEKGSSRIPQSAERSLTSTPLAASNGKSGDTSGTKTPTSSLMRTTASSINRLAAKNGSTPVAIKLPITKEPNVVKPASAVTAAPTNGACKPTLGSTITASRQSIAQRSKEALLKHQERMRAKAAEAEVHKN